MSQLVCTSIAEGRVPQGTAAIADIFGTSWLQVLLGDSVSNQPNFRNFPSSIRKMV